MQTLRNVLQWFSAAAEALKWQPPDHMMLMDTEQVERGGHPVELASRSNRRASRSRTERLPRMDLLRWPRWPT